ncbi:MAG: hypothetical protein C4308_05570 [Chitinophagaceae bacterium]
MVKKLLVVTFFAVTAIVLLISFWPKNFTGSFKEENEESEDGIIKIQEQEFNATKDPALGIVPKYRLYNTIANAWQQFQLTGGSTNRIEALSWTERGSYSDAVGPSNGNGRPGTPTPVTSGRMRAIWVDLTNSQMVWAAGIDGGLWKTNNITASPATWTLVNDFFANMAIGSICQNPSNTDIMYFGTGEKSFNVDGVQGGGVWKSTDHGVTWNLLANTTGFWNVSKLLCDNSGNVYVGTIGSGNGLQRSTDGGTSWTNIIPYTAGGGTRISDMVFSSTGRLHVTKGYYNSPSNQSGYFYTDNPSTVTSSTWSSPVTPISPLQYNVALAASGTTIYALPSSSGFQTPTLWKSTDNGVNWSATSAVLSTSGNNAVSSGQAWYCIALGVDPANANNVIVGGLNCWKSTDGGNNFSQISIWVGSGATNNYIHADQHIATWNGNQVLIGSDGGIFYSADAGTTWFDRNVNLRLKQFYSCAIHPTAFSNYFLAGAQDNGVHQFNGAGLTTSVEVTGGDGAFTAIDQDQTAFQFGSYVYNHYRRSTNSGSSWGSIDFYKGTAVGPSEFGSFINPFDYDDVGNIIYGGADGGEFFRWTSPQATATGTYYSSGPPGTNWNVANAAVVTITGLNARPVTAVTVSPYTANRVFLGTDQGRVIRVDGANTIASGSAGTNITGSSFPATSTISSINFGTTENNIIVSFSNYGINNVWVSTDGGTNWTAIDGNLPNLPVRWAIFNPGNNTQAILATEAGIYETTLINGGSTSWTHNSTFPYVRTDMLQYRSSDRTLIAATHGRGLWSTIIPTVLPVSLLNFSGILKGDAIKISWSTASEQNTNYFDLQKSSDGINFSSLTHVPTAGNSSTKKNYEYTDNQVNEYNYYRLKIVDNDGMFVYSKVILLKQPAARQQVWVTGNPFHSSIRIKLSKLPQEKITCELVSMTGTKMLSQQLNAATEIVLDISKLNLPAGPYVLKVTADRKQFSFKLIRE